VRNRFHPDDGKTVTATLWGKMMLMRAQQAFLDTGIPYCQSTWMSVCKLCGRPFKSASLRLNISETNGDCRLVEFGSFGSLF